jgi:molybdopterin-guanine dinucleotide biosynthesis protein A
LKISCIVLAGGKSLRFGRDKIQENIGDRSLLQWVVSGVSSFSSEIIVVTAAGRSLPRLVGYSKLKVITDIYPDKSALGGIFTGLSVSATPYNLVVASDIPFLNQDLLRYMVGLASGYDVLIPRIGEWVEPLHAVYSRSCLGPMEEQIRRGDLAVRTIFDRLKVRYVEAAEVDRFDPRHLSFFNINTAADLERARRLAGETDVVKCC